MKQKVTLLSLITLFILSSCGTAKMAVDPYVGTWDVTTKGLPQGDITSTMTITKTDQNTYEGELASQMGTMTLNDLTIVNNTLTAKFNVQDMVIDYRGTFSGDTFTGTSSSEFGEFKLEGKRKTVE